MTSPSNWLPRSQRSRSSEEIATALRRHLQGIPGVVIRARAGGGFFFMRGAGGQERVQVEVRGFDLEKSDALGQQVKKIVEGVRGVSDVRLSRELGKPEELLVIDRPAAADMKLSVSQIGGTLETVLSGTQASTFREGGKEYRILVKVKDAETLTIDEILLNLTLTNSDGQPVSLRNVVAVKARSGPQRIERRDRERVLTISAEIEDRDLASILADIRAGLRRVPIPRDFAVTFTGDYEEQQKAFRELLISIILALMLVYMVMAMQFESMRDPLIVMFSVPLAVIGVVWMLLLTGTTFNMQSYIGCIMLGGIVVNNAILLVDHTNLLRRRDKMALREAIEEAGPPPPAPHPDDRHDDHPGHAAAGHGAEGRERGPGADGPRRGRRPAELEPDHADRHPRRLFPVRGQEGQGVSGSTGRKSARGHPGSISKRR